MLRTWRFHCCDLGSILGWGIVNKILQVAWHGRKEKEAAKAPLIQVTWPRVADLLLSLECCSSWGDKELDTT